VAPLVSLCFFFFFVMFQRKSSSSLPTTTSSLNVPSGDTSGGGFGSSRPADGSGKAIRMDAPVVKAWKQSSPFTKYSYYILLACLFSIYMGYRYLRYWNGECQVTRLSREETLELDQHMLTHHLISVLPLLY